MPCILKFGDTMIFAVIYVYFNIFAKNSELKGKDINPLSKDIRVVSANEFLFTVLRSMFSLLM